jgi:redox-regulated HSP33 family molecular chaperone
MDMLLKGMVKDEVLYYCPCTKNRVMDAIVALGREDIEELVSKGKSLMFSASSV